MNVAFGMKAHSGWAALVALGKHGSELTVIDRRRIDLVEEDWAKQPYHAAENLKPDAAREMVRRGIEAAHRIAIQELRSAVKRAREAGHKVTACAVLVGSPMPDWSVDEILAVHFRMHKAEGVLFRDALTAAAKKCGLRFVGVPEKELNEYAERTLAATANSFRKAIPALGKSAGPPWGKDQKEASLAAIIALEGKV